MLISFVLLVLHRGKPRASKTFVFRLLTFAFYIYLRKLIFKLILVR